MKVVILSDTHMPKRGSVLPERFLNELNQADHIIHAGDWSTLEVHEILSPYAPVTGVQGNIDDEQIREKMPEREIITLNGFRIGIVHGHGSGKTTERRAFDTFVDEPVDVIIFGHSHIPLLRYFKQRLLINPGSLMDKRTNPYYSFAVMNLGEEIEVQHVFFS
ncbi:phosphoesterase [Sporosarcina newyorkensis 2681]|uniref:Phosphoesterase n=1 Tax=Sporosarcina newyorkensis 2681 TaxID=1027292 RepID=F9DRQ6_9BACL|nr:metallophosphoesterase family protein [Sporosarcina newyorkensis]EGQ26559.1 phosphoesterase [Sporosarcina newyorkensis 2681]